jgi:LAS superfamily LD-carboxypeptidase LdcB
MSTEIKTLDPKVLEGFLDTFNAMKKVGLLRPTLTVDELKKPLNVTQKRIVDLIMKLDPMDYGVNTPYAGDLEPVPKNLVIVNGQVYVEDGETKVLDDKYVPRHIYDAYLKMEKSFKSTYPYRSLLIGACYRSPAYQVVVFINWLISGYKGDIGKTIRHASPPAYSQHTIASKAAIDFKTVDGKPSDIHPEDFIDTLEYDWLRKNANKFNFYESWLEDNEFGMRAEPWHWQYLESKPKSNAD